MRISNALRMFLWMTLLTGIVYPLFITLIAQLTMHHKANGSIILSNGKMVGSDLIGQKFDSNMFFWGRPSATDYNPLPSGGSNFGPISIKLKDAVNSRKMKLQKSEGSSKNIPTELLYASGSGLDPHISPAAARYQLERIVKSRSLAEDDKQKIDHLIDKMTCHSFFGILGPEHINVLELNIALDSMFHSKSKSD